MNEDGFFATIATRLGRSTSLVSAPCRTETGSPDFWRDAESHPRNVVETFRQEVEVLGGEVYVLEDASSLRDALRTKLGELSPLCVGSWGGGFLNHYELHDVLEPYNLVEWGAHGVAEYQTVDLSLSGCAYAIADTGTIVMMASANRGRSVSVLPTVHIIIVEATQIRRRLGEVLQDLSVMGRDLPSSVHFISGPSRSSDIENDQTIGIHGPAALIVYVMRSEDDR